MRRGYRGIELRRRGGAEQQGIAAFVLAAFLAAVCAFCTSQASAVELIDVARPAAMDQPQIYLLLRNTPDGAPIVGQVSDPLDPFGTPQASISLSAYLDTGASGILISTANAANWNLPDATYNGQTIQFTDIGVGGAAPFHVSQPVYISMAPYIPGVNDDQLENPAIYNQTINTAGSPAAVRMQVGPISDPTNLFNSDPGLALLLDDLNVVGMPGMTGKVMVVDARRSNQAAHDIEIQGLDGYIGTNINNLNNMFLKTYLYNPGTPFKPATVDTDPGIPSTNLNVKLSYADFSGFTTTTPSGAPGPTMSHNPFVGPNPLSTIPGNPYHISADSTPGVKIGFGGLSATGSFLLDTGAGASFISDDIASKLHVRYTAGTEGTDQAHLELFDPATGNALATPLPQFQLAVGGIGGSITTAGFYLDSMLIKTLEGSSAHDKDPRNLNFVGAPVLVTNITVEDPVTHLQFTLDGDLGVNFLVAGLELSSDPNNPLGLNIGNFHAGAFDYVTFDEAAGILGLKLGSTSHIGGDFDLDGKLTNADIQGMLKALQDPTSFETANGLSPDEFDALADVNQDGVVDSADLQSLLSVLAGGDVVPGIGGAVPEPASVVLLGMGAVILLSARRRRI